MPAVMPALVGGHLEFGFVLAAGEQRLVDGRQGSGLWRRRARRPYVIEMGQMWAGLGRPHRGLGGTDDVRAGAVVGPWRAMQP